MKFNANGLALLRRISPPRELEKWLDENGDLIPIETGSGRDMRVINHVDDDVPRDEQVTEGIVGTPTRDGSVVGGCTDGWSIIDQNYRIRAFYTSLPRAVEALDTARVEIRTEFEIEGLEDADDAAKPSKTKPAAVAASPA